MDRRTCRTALVSLAALLWLAGCTGYDNGGFGPSQRTISSTSSPYHNDYRSRGGGSIRIRNASYQADNGRRCDARGSVRSECDGEASCSVEASNDLCGDPAPSHRKTLSVEYDCGGRSQTVSAREKRSVELSCD